MPIVKKISKCLGNAFLLTLALLGLLGGYLSINGFTPGTVQENPLLSAKNAFNFSVEKHAGKLTVHWIIADGYYMYRNKLAVITQQQKAIDIPYPAGEPKQDKTFGNVQVLTNYLRYDIPLSELDGAKQLDIHGQGCNEPVGVCYPPMVHHVDIDNLLSTTTPSLSSSSSQTPLLNASTGSSLAFSVGEDTAQLDPVISDDVQATVTTDDALNELAKSFPTTDFLPVDDAFKVSVETVSDSRHRMHFTVTPGYYLYRDKIKLSLAEDDHNAQISHRELADGTWKKDPIFGEVKVFLDDTALDFGLVRNSPEQQYANLTIAYQGCAIDGICYAPVSKNVRFDFTTGEFSALADDASTITTPKQSSSLSVTLLLSALIAGIGLTFTPCVLPMIPILFGVIGKRATTSRGKGAYLASIYVLGTMISYAFIGFIAGKTGDQLQSFFQTPLAIGLLVIILLLMAAGMFGWLTIQLPNTMQNRLNGVVQKLGDSPFSILVLGMFSALIVGACVSPILFSFVSLIISIGNPWAGALIMATLALGMGLLLIVFGFGASTILPKAGAWMNRINHAFGFLLVGVVIYLLQAFPAIPVLYLWAVLFIAIAIYCWRIFPHQVSSSSWASRLSRGAGGAFTVWAVLCVLAGWHGQRDAFSSNIIHWQQGHSEATALTRIDTLAQLDTLLAQADQQKRWAMIDFYADWCADCITMEQTTFQDSDVVAALQQNFVSIQVDITDSTSEFSREVKQRYAVFGPPAVIFIDPAGNMDQQAGFYGYLAAPAMADKLRQIAASNQ